MGIISNYLAAGTVVWVVDPEAQTLAIHTASQPAKVFTTDDTLTGGNILKDFEVEVAAIVGVMA